MAYLELIEGKSGMDVCQFMESEFFVVVAPDTIVLSPITIKTSRTRYRKRQKLQKIRHKSPHSVKSTKDNESQITES